MGRMGEIHVPAVTTDEALRPDTLFADRYEILGEIGVGSFGRVYRARQLSTGQDVAIKTIRLRDRDTAADLQRHVDRFRREMRLCATLAHPHIVALRDSGELAGELLFAVFEYVPGVTLREIIESEGKLDPSEAILLMTQVLDALSCAHAQGIVHRDIKPENIMITKTGVRRHALVLDFGLGGFAADYELASARLTATQEMMGTPCYAAPEQLRGDVPSPRSDLYSWGLVFLECLTGEIAIGGATAHEVLMRQLSAEPVPIPSWLRRQRLGRLLEVVTVKDLDERRVTVSGLLETLTSIERDTTPPHGGVLTTPREGERRQLTLVACRTVVARTDGTAVELEDLDQILQAQLELYDRLSGPRGGMVVAAAADRALVAFGHPRAQENDARRAVRTALRLAAETRIANAHLKSERGIDVAVHIGVHSGLVIVRDGPAGLDIVGVAPQVAARIADRAADGVLVTDETKKLLRGEIACADAGLTAEVEPGKPMALYRVSADEIPPGIATGGSGEAQLVERAEELGQLLGAWQRAEAGIPRVVLLTGEPGIGKSRLVRELRQAVPAGAWLECRCVQENVTSPLRPIVDLLNGMRESPEELVHRVGLESLDTISLLTNLTSAPLDQPAGQMAMSPEVQKERTLGALVSLLLRMGEKHPLVFVVEDLHWADPTTVELLSLLVDELRAAPVAARLCVVLTARPEFAVPWNVADVTTIAPPRLTRAGVGAMVQAQITGTAPVSDVIDNIAQRTDGIPLFVEEMTHLLFESGALAGVPQGGERGAWATAIPGTLRELLTARLDALSAGARETVQLASAVGREVRYEVLASAADRDEGLLRRDLRELIDARVLQQRRSSAHESYVFRHALVRDAAYETMLRATRGRVHRRIAEAIRDRFPDVAEQQPELLAQHLEAGGKAGDAAAYWQRAGDRALRRAAYAEARQHLEQGLAAAASLASSPERMRAEVELLTSLGTVLLSTQGFAAEEVEATFERARALCDRMGGNVPPKILSGLIGVTITRGDQDATDRLLTHLRRFAESERDVVEQVTGITGLGIDAFWRGAHAVAHDYFERARPLYRSDTFQGYVREYGYDGGIFSYAYSALNHMILGRPVEAERIAAELIEIAEPSLDPHARSLAMSFAVHVAYAAHDDVETMARAERLLAISGEQKLMFWMTLGMCGRGVGMARSGSPAEGLAEVRQGVALTNMMGARLVYGYYLVFLADALLAAGELDEARTAVAEGLQVCGEQLGRFYEPELLRLDGAVLAAQGDPTAAEARLRSALALAHERGAVAFELRAATGLAALLHGRGDLAAARAAVTEALAPFCLDVDSTDLRAARALLATLG